MLLYLATRVEECEAPERQGHASILQVNPSIVLSRCSAAPAALGSRCGPTLSYSLPSLRLLGTGDPEGECAKLELCCKKAGCQRKARTCDLPSASVSESHQRQGGRPAP